MENDQIKRDLCKQQGIILIEIPFSVPYEEIFDYILSKCKAKSIEVPEMTKEIDFNKIINESYVISTDQKDDSQRPLDDYIPDVAENRN